ANVSIWNRDAANQLPIGNSVSFIPTLVQIIVGGGRIGGVVLGDRKWFNIGSPREYLEVHRSIFVERWRPAYLDPACEWPVEVAPDATVHATAVLSGFYLLGPSSDGGADAQLTDSILWAGAQIASRSRLRSCIVRTRQAAEGTFDDAIV